MHRERNNIAVALTTYLVGTGQLKVFAYAMVYPDIHSIIRRVSLRALLFCGLSAT